MIFVFRDFSKIDKSVLDAAKVASDALSEITDVEKRKAFIAQHSNIWTAFRPALRQMSHNKCWYSEAMDSVSRYDVDHFRPKGAAKISRDHLSDGYSWLAFDPRNFILAGALCNQANREYSDTTVGKANWFPLQNPAKAATFQNQDISIEEPILLDPTDPDAPPLLEFGEDGSVQPRGDVDAELKTMIEWAINLLGIRQTTLNGVRAEHWRKCRLSIRQYKRIFQKPKSARTHGELQTMKELAEEFVRMASCRSPFTAMTRDLLRAERLDFFIRQDEYTSAMGES